MKKSSIIIAIITLIIVAVAAVLLYNNQPDPKPAPVTPTPSASTSSSATASGLTRAQVALHRTQTDCYTIINNSVYDLTPWIDKHPGGRMAIIGLCGTDGTSAFTEQHGGQRRPESELASFKIGTLVQ